MHACVHRTALLFRCIAVAAVFMLASSCEDGGEEETCGMDETEKELFDLINDLRASGTDCSSGHIGPVESLKCHPALVSAAHEHSADMAVNDYFGHNGLDGRTPWDRFRDAGYTDGGAMAENIAGGRADPAEVLEQWKTSDQGHCEYMMGAAYHVAGVGHAYSDDSTYRNYWTLGLAAGGD